MPVSPGSRPRRRPNSRTTRPNGSVVSPPSAERRTSSGPSVRPTADRTMPPAEVDTSMPLPPRWPSPMPSSSTLTDASSTPGTISFRRAPRCSPEGWQRRNSPPASPGPARSSRPISPASRPTDRPSARWPSQSARSSTEAGWWVSWRWASEPSGSSPRSTLSLDSARPGRSSSDSDPATTSSSPPPSDTCPTPRSGCGSPPPSIAGRPSRPPLRENVVRESSPITADTGSSRRGAIFPATAGG